MKIAKPIFIIGVGRSGSTIFQKVLSKHPDAAWFNRFSQSYPKYPALNRLAMNMIDVPLVGQVAKKRINTFESFNFWEHYVKGFRRPCRDLFAEDVTDYAKKQITQALEQIITSKRNRLMLKITGWPRASFLKEIFPDAKFIHIVRDGRAVVNSMLKVNFWEGWMGPSNWRWGNLSEKYYNEWENSGYSFVILAAIQWKMLMDSYVNAKTMVGSDIFMEIKYEDFCHSPSDTLKRVAGFCELEWLKAFETEINKVQINNSNTKWQQDLTSSQQELLNKSLSTHLKILNYI